MTENSTDHDALAEALADHVPFQILGSLGEFWIDCQCGTTTPVDGTTQGAVRSAIAGHLRDVVLVAGCLPPDQADALRAEVAEAKAELHHFEVEQENADLRARLNQAEARADEANARAEQQASAVERWLSEPYDEDGTAHPQIVEWVEEARQTLRAALAQAQAEQQAAAAETLDRVRRHLDVAESQMLLGDPPRWLTDIRALLGPSVSGAEAPDR